MRIQIGYDKEEKLIISNDLLDNDNFVEMWFEREDDECEDNIVSIDELKAAIKAFDDARFSRLKREKYYD